jgi:hypothetical protein
MIGSQGEIDLEKAQPDPISVIANPEERRDYLGLARNNVGQTKERKMKIKDLLEEWEKSASEKRAAHKYNIKLPISVAAHIRALAEMYPGRSESEILVDLLSTALDELLEAFPYVKGECVIGEDEFGESVYEDIGPTPRFIKLTNKHTQILERELGEKG